MEEIREFFEANREKKKIIVLGESHALMNESRKPSNTYPFLFQAVGKQAMVIAQVKKLDPDFQYIYTELPTDMKEKTKGSDNFVVPYIQYLANKLGLQLSYSNIGCLWREALGMCDDLYSKNIQKYQRDHGANTIIAILGLLHAADMKFDESVAVLRINCLPRKDFEEMTPTIERNAPLSYDNIRSMLFLEDSKEAEKITREILKEKLRKNQKERNAAGSAAASSAAGTGLVFPSSATAGSAAAGAGSVSPSSATAGTGLVYPSSAAGTGLVYPSSAAANSAAAGAGPVYPSPPLGDSFTAEWVKREKYNDWVVKCPVCGSISGSYLIITHLPDCPVKDKKINIPPKPNAGGRRKVLRKHSRSKYRTRKHKTRKHKTN